MLDQGASIGGYRIEAVLGRGTSGVVLRAFDPQLERWVALRVVVREPGDDGARDRFLEACRLTASIDEPGILPIIEVGEDGARAWVVMPFMAGDLDEVLASAGPLEIPRLLELGRRLATALDAAHARGLVHGDVRPGSVLLRTSDTPEQGQLAGFRTGPTSGHAADRAGLALTLAAALDGRARSAADAILERALDGAAPDRWPDCRSMVEALATVLAPVRAVHPRAVSAAARPRSARRRAPIGLPALGAVALAIVVGVAAVVGVLGTARSDRAGGLGGPFSASDPVHGTAHGSAPSVAAGRPAATPDATSSRGPGEVLDYLPPQELPGTIVFALRSDRTRGFDLMTIRPDGARPASLVRRPGDQGAPAVSPDGTRVAFVSGPAGGRTLWILHVADSRVTRLTRDTDMDAPAWSPAGDRLVYARAHDGVTDLETIRVSPDGRAVGGPATLLAGAGAGAQPSWSADGSLIAFASEDGGASAVLIVPADGSGPPRRMGTGDHVDGQPRWMPDGRLLLARGDPGRRDIVVMSDPLGSARTRRVTKGAGDDQAGWPSPEGSAIVYVAVSAPGPASGLFLQALAGGAPNPVLTGAGVVHAPTWTAADLP